MGKRHEAVAQGSHETLVARLAEQWSWANPLIRYSDLPGWRHWLMENDAVKILGLGTWRRPPNLEVTTAFRDPLALWGPTPREAREGGAP